jgi:MFS family permease
MIKEFFQSRNLPILSASQAMAGAGPAMVILLGGLIGSSIAPNPSMATLPVSVLIVGVALFSIPASMIMRKVGRKRGFMGASLIACLGALLAAYAISIANFNLFCLATLFIGSNIAFVQQYRFAASESVPSNFAPRAVSVVLFGGLLAGFFGPEVARLTQDMLPSGLYTGSFVALAALYAVVIIIQSFMEKTIPDQVEVIGEERPLKQIMLQPTYMVALLAGVVSYGVMSFIMTATPIQVHQLDGFNLDATAFIIQSHILAMYLPSLFTGFMLERLGLLRVMLAGVLSLVASVLISLSIHTYIGYWGALVMLGLGWNFLFVGGTVLLTRSYLPPERFKAQAANDFTVFGTQAFASLSAGTVLYIADWIVLNMIVLPLLLVTFIAILLLRRQITPAPSQA